MQTERDQFGLNEQNLRASTVTETVIVVVITIFASLFFTRIESSVSQRRIQQITLIALSATFAVFTLIRLYISSRIAKDIGRYSRDYSRLILEIAQFLRRASLILLTHFLSSAFIKLWTDMQMSAHESFDAMARTFLFVYLALQVVKKSQQ